MRRSNLICKGIFFKSFVSNFYLRYSQGCLKGEDMKATTFVVIGFFAF